VTLPYLGFHLLFVLPPIALLAAAVGRLPRASVAGVALLAGIALVYTTPWDNYLILRGVWSYPSEALALRFGLTPLGEYLFFVLQSVLTGLWFHRLVGADAGAVVADVGTVALARPVGVGVWFALTLVGGTALSTPEGYYLGAILLWAAPIVALQWGFGGPALWRHRRVLAAGIGVPTLYLCVVDSVAIHHELWTISPDLSSGVHLLGLPVEEALFFLLTNVLIVQGLLLFHWVLARAETGSVRRALDELLPGAVRRWR